MSDEFKGYSLFNDVNNIRLRTWNRCAAFFSIFEDHGKAMAQSYANQLDDVAKKQMTNMLAEIREQGYGTVRQSVIKSHKLN